MPWILSRSAHWTSNFTNPEFFVYLLFEYFLQAFVESIGWTKTKYVKLKTKPQNNIVILGFSSKNGIVILAFFEKNWLKYECLQKNQQF